MTVERTLARVEDDLSTGDVAMARRRLQSLVESLPHRLEARERLAEIYRLDGNHIEAGRWSYLDEHAAPGDIAAFERACRHNPVRIMRGLSWRGPEEAAATEFAQQRLRDVRTRAEAAEGKKLDWSTGGRDVSAPWTEGAWIIGCALAGLVLGALVVVGAVTVIGWIF
ncbi:DUF6584 family protein [uncultured Cellulomonas sp.]|uniref:DUF6584 family protein n=1 Tax=uncultured Cellulomonas sp. TaxID=189682 RepID=UPI0028E71DFE|nr:DUF6584 family protein [uncultured Cellulomonas sp.]